MKRPLPHPAPGRPPQLAGHTPRRHHGADTALTLVPPGGGQALPPALCQDMGERFGVDFSAVRVHADARAAASARAQGAAAFALGRQLVFGAGRYAPDTATGRRLLAHELAHVVQQSRGGSGAEARGSGPPGAEARADVAALQATGSGRVQLSALGSAPTGLQAQPDPALAPGQAQSPTSADATDTPAQPAPTTTTLSGFALNRAELTAAHQQQIETLAWGIKMHLSIRVGGLATIHVTGHTDRSGDEALNLALGQQRADAVQAALRSALAKEGVTAPQIVALDATSLGEGQPAVATADGVKNPANRRVEIQLDLGQAAPEPAPATAPPKINLKVPGIDPFAPPVRPPGPYRDPSETELNDRIQKVEQGLKETQPKVPKPRSPLEVLTDKVLDAAEPFIKKMPRKFQGPLRSAVRAGLEKGSEAAIDAAIDATGATGEGAEGVKAAAKAAWKQKAGGGPTP